MSLTLMAVAAFNLNCVGEQTILSVRPPARIAEPYSRTYRVDLDRMEWCAGDCSETLDISTANQRGIIFFDTPKGGADRRTDMVNRETGSHFAVFSGEGYAVAWRGVCTAVPFTALPPKREHEPVKQRF